MTTRLLVVDDEPSLVRGLTYALEREGFEVQVARDGPEAVEFALGTPVDLVVLDVMLPTLSGTDVCRQIRVRSAVPIIMVTARDAERDLLEGLEVGADDYLTKPFSSAELIGRIRALLRRRDLDRAAERPVLRVGDLTIDLVHDEVAVAGRRIPLTPSEFKVLSLLATQPGAVFSRRQIMERLWGSRHVGDEHTCEVHVSSLRRKIEPNALKPPRIVTVRGRGYRLVAPDLD
jgi:two-component system, OmpR family, response regulator RegX3